MSRVYSTPPVVFSVTYVIIASFVEMHSLSKSLLVAYICVSLHTCWWFGRRGLRHPRTCVKKWAIIIGHQSLHDHFPTSGCCALWNTGRKTRVSRQMLVADDLQVEELIPASREHVRCRCNTGLFNLAANRSMTSSNIHVGLLNPIIAILISPDGC